jgi:hypothetical protein
MAQYLIKFEGSIQKILIYSPKKKVNFTSQIYFFREKSNFGKFHHFSKQV